MYQWQWLIALAACLMACTRVCNRLSGEPFVQELQSAGVEGLVRATKLFDPSKGFKFSTYAHWWIRQAITKAMSLQSRIMYVPQNVYELAVQVNHLQAELASEYGSSGTVPESVLAAGVGITVKRLRDVRLAMRDPVSLNAPIKADSDNSIQDTIQVRWLVCWHAGSCAGASGCCAAPMLHVMARHVARCLGCGGHVQLRRSHSAAAERFWCAAADRFWCAG